MLIHIWLSWSVAEGQPLAFSKVSQTLNKLHRNEDLLAHRWCQWREPTRRNQQTSELSLSARGHCWHDLSLCLRLTDGRLHTRVMERHHMANIHDKSPVRQTLIPVNKQRTKANLGRIFFCLRRLLNPEEKTLWNSFCVQLYIKKWFNLLVHL